MKVLMKAALSICCLLFMADAATACLCVPRSISQKKKHAITVFTGTVVENKQVFVNGELFYRARIIMERYWKRVEPAEVIVYSGSGCMAWFELGQKYLVYAYIDKESG